MNNSLRIDEHFLSNHWEIKISQWLGSSVRSVKNPFSEIVENFGRLVGNLLYGFVEKRLLKTIYQVQELTTQAKVDRSLMFDESYLKVYSQLKAYKKQLDDQIIDPNNSSNSFLKKYLNIFNNFIDAVELLHLELLKNTELAFDFSEEDVDQEWGERSIK